jgi:hypothetical protein
MKPGKWLWGVLLVVVAAAGGCGRNAKPTATPEMPKSTAGVPLPEWAPKNPSPEFLRAARVLKPTPQDAFTEFANSDPAKFALVQRAAKTWSAAYEFFGTLSDGQMQRFLSTKEIRVPVGSLTATQRAALGNWFASWRRAMKDNGPVPDGILVLLLKMGAREDLSNVDVGFTAQNEAHRVHIIFWRGPGSSFKTDFANM